MRNKKRFETKTVLFPFILILFLLSILWPNIVGAQTADAPWPMFRQNPQHTGQRSPNSESNEPQVVKEKFSPIDTGPGFITDITSSPSIASDGTVFIGSLDKNFFAINPDSGQIISEFSTFNSIFSSPAIGINGNIYIASWDGILYELQFNGTNFTLLNFVQAGAENFGHLSGKVEDGDLGGAIVGASISVAGKTVFTDINGDFFIDNIPKGVHEVFVSAGGKDCDRTFTAEICGFQHIQATGVVTLLDFVTTITLEGVEESCPVLPEITVGGCEGIISSSEQTEIEGIASLPSNLDGIASLKTFNRNLLIERGIASSPLIGFNNWVFWGSQNGRFYGWDLDLKAIFFKELGGPIIASPAQSLDGTVYVVTLNGELSAFNPDFSEVFEKPFAADGEVRSSPAIGIDGTIYFGSLDNNLYAVQPDGKLKWKFPTGGVIVSSPAIDVDGTIYVGSDDGNLYAIEDRGVNDPVAKWTFPAGSEIAGSSASIGKDGTVYIGVGGEFPKVLAIAKANGALKWCFETENGITSTPAIAEDGSIYVGSFDGKVYVLEAGESSGLFTISGTIRDTDNNLVEDALVEITKIVSGELECESPFSASMTTGADGSYKLEKIPSGLYNIAVSKDGFASESQELEDNLNSNLTLDFVIEAEDISVVEIEEISFLVEIDEETCFPLRVQFTDTSKINPPDAPIEFTWNFGDGASSNLKNPEHEYTETGQFAVELRIQSPGTSIGASTTSLVTVKDPPCARFKPISIKVKPGQPINFTDLSISSESEEIIKREWRFSINRSLQNLFLRRNISDAEQTAHQFYGKGVHSVSLFVQQSDGKDDKAFGTITVVNEF